MYYTVLEITVGHWPFSDQFQHFADQNPFDRPNLLYIFNGMAIDTLQKMSCFQKMADQFLTLISTTDYS